MSIGYVLALSAEFVIYSIRKYLINCPLMALNPSPITLGKLIHTTGDTISQWDL